MWQMLQIGAFFFFFQRAGRSVFPSERWVRGQAQGTLDAIMSLLRGPV